MLFWGVYQLRLVMLGNRIPKNSSNSDVVFGECVVFGVEPSDQHRWPPSKRGATKTAAKSEKEIWLVVWNMFSFSIHLGMSSSQLTFTPSFFRGVGLNHQPEILEQLWCCLPFIERNWISAWPVPQALPMLPANCSASETGSRCRFGSAAIPLKNWIAASLCKRHWIGSTSILCHRIMPKKIEIRCYFYTRKISCIPSISQLLFPSSLMISSSHCFESLVNKSPNWVIACITGPTSPIYLLISENQ